MARSTTGDPSPPQTANGDTLMGGLRPRWPLKPTSRRSSIFKATCAATGVPHDGDAKPTWTGTSTVSYAIGKIWSCGSGWTPRRNLTELWTARAWAPALGGWPNSPQCNTPMSAPPLSKTSSAYSTDDKVAFCDKKSAGTPHDLRASEQKGTSAASSARTRSYSHTRVTLPRRRGHTHGSSPHSQHGHDALHPVVPVPRRCQRPLDDTPRRPHHLPDLHRLQGDPTGHQ